LESRHHFETGNALPLCAILAESGAVVCWGDNRFGQAAPPDTVNGVAGTASAVAANERHSCAIRAEAGAVVCWGDDYWGQATPPAAVDGTAGTASAIAVGETFSLAIGAPEPGALALGTAALAAIHAIAWTRRRSGSFAKGVPTRAR